MPEMVLAEGPGFAPGEVLVKFRRDDPRPPLRELAGYPVASARELFAGMWVYELSERSVQATQFALAFLEAQPDVEYAEVNRYRRTFAVPNDPHYAYQWNLSAINLPKAWDRSKGSAQIVVAVVDTGVLSAHPDLGGRLVAGYDFISGTTDSGDGDGWDSDPKDMGTDSKSSSALHGTHVAGIIAAASNNASGMTGVDWTCKLQPVRALGVVQGQGKDSDIVAAIRWASGLSVTGASSNKTPARVINLSFGGQNGSTTLTQAVQAAQQNGAIVVAAVGNDNLSADNIHPAAIKDVIAVGAVDQTLKKASYSNYGSVVDIMAPGGDVSQILGGGLKCSGQPCPAGVLGPIYDSAQKIYGFTFYQGTSQAAPMVSGVVALMLSMNSTLSGTQVLALLVQTGNPTSKCTAGCGAGLVNADAALAAAQNAQGQQKLPFSASCSNDTQCQNGVCRTAGGTTKICTRFCSLGTDCPSGATCQGGLCQPSSSGTCTGTDPCGIPTTIESQTFGCQVPDAPLPREGLLGLLLLGVWLFARRFVGRPQR